MPVWRRRASVAFVDRDGRSALMDLDHPERPPLVLEGSAAEIWQRIDGVRSTEGIVTELVALFGESPEVIEPAVSAFLLDLLSIHLVEEVAFGA